MQLNFKKLVLKLYNKVIKKIRALTIQIKSKKLIFLFIFILTKSI